MSELDETKGQMVANIFEYLLALKQLSTKTIRSLDEYGENWWSVRSLPTVPELSTWQEDEPEVWLRVKKPKNVIPCRVPDELREWVISSMEDPLTPPRHQDSIIRFDRNYSDDQKPHIEKFDDDRLRPARWRSWVDSTWAPWADVTRRVLQVRAIYDNLFDLYQRLQKEESVEVFFGHGMLRWKIGNLEFKHPVLITRMELEFDPSKGVFTLSPAEIGTALELDFLNEVDLPNKAHLNDLRARVKQDNFDVWNDRQREVLLRELAHLLDRNGSFAKAALSKVDSGALLITDETTIFLRSNKGLNWQKDLQDIISVINAETRPIPRTLLEMVEVESIGEDPEEHKRWQRVGEEILFPLPTNEEQREIVRRLANNHGVVVQGPPGTGKSHTIVNLISHLLAHGKKVLVTSEKERALRVIGGMLREKVPSIAPLCVSNLGSNQSARRELEEAVRAMSNSLSSVDLYRSQERVNELREQIDRLSGEIATLKNRLRDRAESEGKPIQLGERIYTPAELAQFVAGSRAGKDTIPDEVPFGLDLPLSKEEYERLLHLIKTLSLTDIENADTIAPDPRTIMETNALGELFTAYDQAKAKSEADASLLKNSGITIRAEVDLPHLTERLSMLSRQLKQLGDGWQSKVILDLLRSPARCREWRNMMSAITFDLNGARTLESSLLTKTIVPPSPAPGRNLKSDCTLVMEEWRENGKLGFMFKLYKGKEALYVLNAIVDGHRPESSEDMACLVRFIELKEAKERLANRLNKQLSMVGGLKHDPTDPEFLLLVEEDLETLGKVIGLHDHDLKPTVELVNHVLDAFDANLGDIQWVQKAQKVIEAHDRQKVMTKLGNEINEIRRALVNGKGKGRPHPVWDDLIFAFDTRDLNAWQAALRETERVLSIRSQIAELKLLQSKARSVLPLWTNTLRSNGAMFPSYVEWVQAWYFRQAEYLLKEDLAKMSISEMKQQLDKLEDQRRHLTEDIIAAKTWLEQVKRIRPSQRTALQTWVNTVSRITKTGKGKYDAKRIAEAKKLMEQCRPAVPVWIMPMNKVIENISPASEPFDVVIIDESSQSDLFALSALFRGERAVVVGDDKQVSPEGVGKDQSQIHRLIETKLVGVPNATSTNWDLQVSLFDKAREVFAKTNGVLMLREHFRCVPEIIQFSNDNFYSGHIEPLRFPLSSERVEPAVAAVFVADGRWKEDARRYLNEPEARALVDKMVELCKDPKYKEKTMGVISLQGEDQADLINNLLREAIGEEEMVRRRIICGDSKFFQGDERDVMFLSMVVCAEPRPSPMTRKADEQKFNVAASRAKDQMWLFHSVRLEDLKSNDMRSRLLAYCMDPTRTQIQMNDAADRFAKYGSSKFHQEVYRLIVAKGYRAIPEYVVGTHPYRIDIVIEGVKGRLAVECDGDAWHGIDVWERDMERQMILERVGWRFWRIRASDFYLRREAAMEGLWSLLNELHIEQSNSLLGPVETDRCEA